MAEPAAEETMQPGTIPPRAFVQDIRRIEIDRDVRLVVTILTPNTPGPFPIVMFNHGADGTKKPADQPRHWKSFASYYFLSRGYAVVLPMARGFGGSDGSLRVGRCRADDLGQFIAQDDAAVLKALANDPKLDTTRVVAAGQSFGGWNALAMGSEHIPGVRAIVNFNGGVNISTCGNSRNSLAQGAAAYGMTTTAPSLWFYGENDSVFPVKVWRAMYDAYEAQGGHAELVDVGSVGSDSHQFLSFPSVQSLWVPKVDALLASVGLPHTDVFPEYMPSAPPRPSGFAVIEDVGKLPYFAAQMGPFYAKFLAHPSPRALAISAKGDASAQYGGFDEVAAALAACEQRDHGCRLYAVDDAVVWRPIPAPPAPSGYAAPTDGSKLPYLKQTSLLERLFARPGPHALVLSRDGHGYGVFGVNSFDQAWLNCVAANHACEPYIAADQVVWHPGGFPDFAADEAAQPAVPRMKIAAGNPVGRELKSIDLSFRNTRYVLTNGPVSSAAEAFKRADMAVSDKAVAGVFSNVTTGLQLRFRHAASGMLCPRPVAIGLAPPSELAEWGPAPRAVCVVGVNGVQVDIVIAADAARVSPARALGALVAESLRSDTGLAAQPSSGLAADLEGLSVRSKEEGRVHEHLAVGIVDGWIVATRARGAAERGAEIGRIGDAILHQASATVSLPYNK